MVLLVALMSLLEQFKTRKQMEKFNCDRGTVPEEKGKEKCYKLSNNYMHSVS